MDLRPTQEDESRCHPERSEGSAVPDRGELMQILRFAQNDRLSRECSEESRAALLNEDQSEILRFAQDDSPSTFPQP